MNPARLSAALTSSPSFGLNLSSLYVSLISLLVNFSFLPFIVTTHRGIWGDGSGYKDSINTGVNTLGTDAYRGIVRGRR